MQRLCLTIARFCLSAWIGAAALFVLTAISEQTSPEIGSDVKNLLAAMRFPWYYRFGFGLVGLGTVAGTMGLERRQHFRRWIMILGCLGLALLLMLVDYVAIYSPLYEMVTRPSGVRDAHFEDLHRWSEQINSLHVGLSAIAAVLLCWPRKPPDRMPA